MAKVDQSGVVITLDMLQSGANTDKIGYETTDPFQRKQGFRLKAVEAFFEPSDLYDLAADATLLLQIFAATAAVPTAQYTVSSDNVIAQKGLALPLNTNGYPVIDCGFTWYPPDDRPIDIGATYFGAVLKTAGFTSAVQGVVKLYGDVMVLTTDEINASKALYT